MSVFMKSLTFTPSRWKMTLHKHAFICLLILLQPVRLTTCCSHQGGEGEGREWQSERVLRGGDVDVEGQGESVPSWWLLQCSAGAPMHHHHILASACRRPSSAPSFIHLSRFSSTHTVQTCIDKVSRHITLIVCGLVHKRCGSRSKPLGQCCVNIIFQQTEWIY